MMKKLVLTLLILGIFATPSLAIKLTDLDIDIGLQHRVMYNYSNIGSREDYDFFRQRLRLVFDIHTEEGVGSFMQLEFRGGWGGSSPAASDPRGTYAINAFNRLEARGVRYGYVYFPLGPGSVNGGILPISDQVNDMIFSADWDFNVGGVSYMGEMNGFDYRLAYIRLVEGVFYRDTVIEDEDLDFIVVDLNTSLGATMKGGIHFYATTGEVCPLGTLCTVSTDMVDLDQIWIGPRITADINALKIDGAVIYNSGERGTVDNDGWLVRLSGSTMLGNANVSLLGIYSTGEDVVSVDNGFQTVQGILGTAGYWGYTYIFSPHGPSDVNDFGLEVGNRGFGLITLQLKADIPLSEKVALQGVAGWFAATEDMPTLVPGKFDDDLGTEFGAQLTINLGKYMNLEVGGGIADLGDAAQANYQGNNEDSVYEIFSRLQLEF